MTRPLALLCSLLVLGLAACGEKEEPAVSASGGALEPFTVMLDWTPNADHAGIFTAQAAGEYARAGLDVKLLPPPQSNPATLPLLQAGKTDLAISYPPDLLLVRDQGRELVSVGALAQKPLTSVITLDKKIRDVSDLAGKRVGTAGIPYQSAYLDTIARDAGINVRETNVGFNFTPAMVSGKVDATLGAFWNYEGVALERRGKRPTIWRMEQLGVPSYPELIFVARRRSLNREMASRIRRFLHATARGHELLRDDPAAGVDALLEAEKGLDRGQETAAVRETLPLFFPARRDLPFGFQDEREWDAYGAWMLRNRLVKSDPQAARAMTNEFLPGEGLDPETAGLD